MTVPFAQDVTLKRWGAGAHASGSWVDGTPATSTIQASVQPAKESDLLRLPEGSRERGAVVLYSETMLTVGDKSQGLKPDEVTLASQAGVDEQWIVGLVDPWTNSHYTSQLEHCRAVVVRADR